MTLADELDRLGKLKTPEILHATGNNSVVTEGNDWSVIFAPGEHIKSRHHAALAALMFNNLPAIIAALREQEWQPIETAPRDGTPYIGRWGVEHRLYGLALMCQFSVTMQSIASRAGIDGDGKIVVIEMAREDWPTHWRALPTPPEQEQEQRKP